MDQVTEAHLNKIRKTHISALTEADKSFLRARAFYLGKRDKKKYADILNAKPAKVKKVKAEKNPLAHPAEL